MDPFKKNDPSYRGISERSKSLLLLLREVPYVTMGDVRKLFYPASQKSYPVVMMGVLLKSELINKHRLWNGVFIYYLAENGRRIADFFIQEKPKYSEAFHAFYYQRPPRRKIEVNPFFFFPSPSFQFHPFHPHYLSFHQVAHTRNLLELYYLFKRSHRFMHVFWLDFLLDRKNELGLEATPDLLLTNDTATERGRIFVELENSRIREERLLQKLDRLCAHPADFYFFLASSEEIFQNLGRLVRKILLGECKLKGHTLFFTPKAQFALSKNVCFGTWIPSSQREGVIQKLSEVELYRYDDEGFDRKVLMNEVVRGVVQKDEAGNVFRKFQTIPYLARKSGVRKWRIADILVSYTKGFQAALDKGLFKKPENQPSHEGEAA